MGAAVLLADGAGLFFRFPLQGIDLGSATAHPASSGRLGYDILFLSG
jgi:hypothetical protein